MSIALVQGKELNVTVKYTSFLHPSHHTQAMSLILLIFDNSVLCAFIQNNNLEEMKMVK